MALKDTTAGPLTATPAEISEALQWAITHADHEASRAVRRDTGLDRVTAKHLEARYRAHRRALSVLALTFTPNTDRTT